MGDSVSVFAEHAADYDAQRRRLVPCFDEFYGTAVEVLGARGGPMRRVLDLGAGTGLLSAAVAERYPGVELVLLDGAAEMLGHARERLRERAVTTIVADLREPLPAGPFDAVVSALAIHHLEDRAKRDLLARVYDALRPGGAFVNAEQVAGATPWLDRVHAAMWSEACRAVGTSREELAAAVERMRVDRCADVASQLEWMRAAGLRDCGCFFRRLNLAVLAGWRLAGS